MIDYNYQPPETKPIKDNKIIWEGKTPSNILYRLVIVYPSITGTNTSIVMEKAQENNTYAMGELKWESVDISNIPDIWWHEILKMLTHDEDIMNPNQPNKKVVKKY